VPTCTIRPLKLLGQLELGPVRQRLFAVDVLAGVDRVDGLRGVMAVRRGNADQIDVGVGQQLLVRPIHLRPTALLRRCHQPRPIDVADGDRPGAALLSEAVDDVDMRLAPPARADEPHADPLVGTGGFLGNDRNPGSGVRSRRSNGRPGRAEKVPPVGVRLVIGLRLAGHDGLLGHGKGLLIYAMLEQYARRCKLPAQAIRSPRAEWPTGQDFHRSTAKVIITATSIARVRPITSRIAGQ